MQKVITFTAGALVKRPLFLIGITSRHFSLGDGSAKQFEDPYFLLGVTRDNVLKEVKKAYFHKAKKYHPDLNPGDDTAKMMFLKIQAAYRAIENELDPTLKNKREN